MALLIRIQNAWRSSCIILGRRGNAEKRGKGGTEKKREKEKASCDCVYVCGTCIRVYHVHVTVSMYVEQG